MPDTQYFSINVFPGDGVQTVFEISFAGGYIAREHVKAYRATLGAANVPVELSWIGPNTVQTPTATPIGSDIVIYRDTPKDLPLADFSDGAVLTETSLDVNAKQAVFIAAEAQDNGNSRIINMERGAVQTPAGGLVTSGFVVVTPDGRAVGQDFFNVIQSATTIYDDGSWGDPIISDGVWG